MKKLLALLLLLATSARAEMAPEFTGGQTWLNSPPLTMQQLRGKVVLVDFWTYSCINCIRTLPTMTGLDETYRDKGLVIIGIHAPEFSFEKIKTNVEGAITKYNIRYPVVLDNKMAMWNAYKNRYWPAHYLIDQQGNIVYTHFGEGGASEMENKIRELLKMAPIADKIAAPVSSTGQTPETYLGSARARGYVASGELPRDGWTLTGKWKYDAEEITSAEKNSSIKLHFYAKKVFLVLGTRTPKKIPVTIRLNGAPYKEFSVDRYMLYELAEQDAPKEGTVEIIAGDAGLEAYAFTFGN